MTTMQIDRAVVEQALEALETFVPTKGPSIYNSARDALRAALAQQDEPLNLRDPAVQKRLATQWGYVPAAQAEPVEPVAWIYQNMYTEQEYLVWKKGTGGRNWRPLYAAPPQRKPLPLKTVEKLIYENTKISPNVADDRELLGYIVNAVRAVERAYGIGEQP